MSAHITPPHLQRPGLRRRCLAAVVAALVPPGAAEAADPPRFLVAGPGAYLDITPGRYESRNDSSHGLWVRNGGQATANGVTFETFGDSSLPVYLTGDASEVEMSAGSLITHGVGAGGLYARDTERSQIRLTGMEIATEGASSNGATFYGRTDGELLGGKVVTMGLASVGVLGENGGQFTIKNTDVSTAGRSAKGLAARDAGSSIRATGTRVHTTGAMADGVELSGAVTATLVDTEVGTSGDYAHAMRAERTGLVTVIGGSLQTTGPESEGLFATENSDVAIEGRTRIDTAGARGVGVDNRSARVRLNDVDVHTAGRSAYGLLAQGGDIPGLFPRTTATATTVVTEGAFAYGARAAGGGLLELRSSTVRTSGANAHGLHIEGGRLQARDTEIETSGDTAYGAIVLAGGRLEFDGGSIVSGTSAALGLHDPATVRIGRKAVLSGGNGRFAEVDPGSTQPFTVTLENGAQAFGDIRLSADPAERASDETKLSLAITGDARWSGATSIVRDLSLDSGGTWLVTGDSRIGSLHNSKGVVAFSPAGVGTFATLTIAGDYVGNDGLFRMRGLLGDDTSPADLVHVLGNTSGTTRIAVDALDASGEYASDGIPLIRVDGRSEGVFALAGRAVAGPYEYFLHKGSVSHPDDGSWYLRSTVDADPVVDPVVGPVVDPIVDPVVEPVVNPDKDPEPPVVVPPPSRILRPEVGAYRANQTAALEMFQGGPGAGGDDEREDARQSVWARFDRRHTAFDIRDELATTASTSELAIGADLLHSDETTEGYAGVMLATGTADTRATSRRTQYSAKGRVRGNAIGLYGGVRTDAGTYLRGWTQYAHFNQRVEGDVLANERYGSGTLTGSVEAGHRWRMTLNRDTDVYLEPQAQLIATRLSGGAHTEANGTHIAPVHGSGATGRIGLRGAARWHTPGGHTASPYFAASWLRRLGHLDATQFGGEDFSAGVPRNAYALKLGVTFLRATSWRLWTDVETRFGANGYRRVTGSLGIRRVW